MRYASLGKSGVQVSAISLGTALFGVAPLAETADRLVGRAMDLGINVIDTANSYGNQPRFDRPGVPPAAERASAEAIVGGAIKGRRAELVLCSKVMERVGEDINARGLSRRHIMEQVECSLRRLGTDHLDVYYAHHPDPGTPLEETMRAFDDLIRQGKIRYCALSTFPAWQVVEALWACDSLRAPAPVCVQAPYNLAMRDAERELIPMCRRHGPSIMAFSPLAGGLLADRANRDREFSGQRRWGGPGFTKQQISLADQLHEISRSSGRSVVSLALGWLIAQPAVASAIIGPETIAELEANVDASMLELDDALLGAVDEVRLPSDT